jgi:hypothetical protein
MYVLMCVCMPRCVLNDLGLGGLATWICTVMHGPSDVYGPSDVHGPRPCHREFGFRASIMHPREQFWLRIDGAASKGLMMMSTFLHGMQTLLWKAARKGMCVVHIMPCFARYATV